MEVIRWIACIPLAFGMLLGRAGPFVLIALALIFGLGVLIGKM